MFPSVSAVEWKTVSLPDGTDFQIALAPPNLALYLDGQWNESDARLVETRFRAISGWRGVFAPRDGGGKSEVPYSEENLVTMLRTHRGLTRQLVDIVRPLFTPIDEATVKNSETPSSEATATSPSPSESTSVGNG